MKNILVATLILLSGCATQPEWRWDKPGATQAELSQDIGQCRAQGLAGTQGMVTPGTAMIMHSCMQGKGWNKVASK